MAYNMNAVIAQHFINEDTVQTYLISGTVTEADLGKAVAWDGTVANTVRLAGDNDRIIGRLQTYTDRTQEKIKTCSVARQFISTFPIKAGETVVVGSGVVGAGAGEVKPAPTPVAGNLYYAPDNFVREIVGTFAVVERL